MWIGVGVGRAGYQSVEDGRLEGQLLLDRVQRLNVPHPLLPQIAVNWGLGIKMSFQLGFRDSR